MDTHKQRLLYGVGQTKQKSWFRIKTQKENLKGDHVQVLNSADELAKSITKLSDFTIAIGGVRGFARFN